MNAIRELYKDRAAPSVGTAHRAGVSPATMGSHVLWPGFPRPGDIILTSDIPS